MIEIGQVIANREVYAIHENSYCIAKSIVPSPEPFTVWNIDANGEGVHTGRYFKEQMDAEWCYSGLCFPWFEDNVHINMIEDKTASKDNEKTVLIDIKKMLCNSNRLIFVGRFGVPKKVMPVKRLNSETISESAYNRTFSDCKDLFKKAYEGIK